jgi:molybdopterin converting factor small subunit
MISQNENRNPENAFGDVMSVTIRLHPFIAGDVIPADSLITEGETVGVCVENLLKRFPSLKEKLFSGPGRLHAYLEVYVNEESAYPHELSTPVREGDQISIICLLAGG